MLGRVTFEFARMLGDRSAAEDPTDKGQSVREWRRPKAFIALVVA
jgi:hypothetical protein